MTSFSCNSMISPSANCCVGLLASVSLGADADFSFAPSVGSIWRYGHLHGSVVATCEQWICLVDKAVVVDNSNREPRAVW